MKKYLRHSMIKGFDNLTTIRDGRILKLLELMFKEDLRKAHEATQRRLKFLRELKECAEDGEIAIVYSGMDCDCSQYSGHYRIVKATKEAVNEGLESIYRGLDGPLYSIELMKPSVASGIEPTSRDLALEAFEDGHQHVVYSSQE